MAGGGRFISARRDLPVGATDVTLMVIRGGYKSSTNRTRSWTRRSSTEEGSMAARRTGRNIGLVGQEYVDAVTVQVGLIPLGA
jgi:hypothetical protein